MMNIAYKSLLGQSDGTKIRFERSDDQTSDKDLKRLIGVFCSLGEPRLLDVDETTVTIQANIDYFLVMWLRMVEFTGVIINKNHGFVTLADLGNHTTRHIGRVNTVFFRFCKVCKFDYRMNPVQFFLKENNIKLRDLMNTPIMKLFFQVMPDTNRVIFVQTKNLFATPDEQVFAYREPESRLVEVRISEVDDDATEVEPIKVEAESNVNLDEID
jgi:hypothetical protein